MHTAMNTGGPLAVRWALTALAGLIVQACGGSAYEYAPSAPAGGMPAEPQPESAMREEVYATAQADSAGAMGGGDWDDFQGEEEARPVEFASLPVSGAVAQAQTPRPQQPAGQGATGNAAQTEQQASDAVDTSGPLLIYTAELILAVYEVVQTQEAIIVAIREMQGFVSERSDSHIVLRVPARRFDDAIGAIEERGDVIGRNVQALDVSEEFRDLQIRIRNAEAMRDRLEALLQRAQNVEEALSIERELQRLTEAIELFKGRQRFLADRISFSTITVRFQSRASEAGTSDEFRLPFEWLDELGLNRLLTLQ